MRGRAKQRVCCSYDEDLFCSWCGLPWTGRAVSSRCERRDGARVGEPTPERARCDVKLTRAQAIEVVRRYTEENHRIRRIADEYGVSGRTIVECLAARRYASDTGLLSTVLDPERRSSAYDLDDDEYARAVRAIASRRANLWLVAAEYEVTTDTLSDRIAGRAPLKTQLPLLTADRPRD